MILLKKKKKKLYIICQIISNERSTAMGPSCYMLLAYFTQLGLVQVCGIMLLYFNQGGGLGGRWGLGVAVFSSSCLSYAYL